MDVFHLVYEGVARQMMKRMFTLSSTTESRAIFEHFNAVWQAMAVFSETPRRTNNMLINQLKGNELAVMTLSAFPQFVTLIEDTDGLW